MPKILWLLKRKPGISFEQFRDHYENSHSVLGKKYLGHLILSYKRNYNPPFASTSDASSTESIIAAKQSDYDCVTEWELRDEDALVDIFNILMDPVIGKIFKDDEEYFLDRNSVRLVNCDARDTGPGDGAEVR